VKKINHSFLANEALKELFADKTENREILVKYSGKFKGFNANVRYTSRQIIFSLGSDWIEVSDDIKKGLMQHLFIKVYRGEKYVRTMDMDLYEKFVSNLGKYVPVDESDEELTKSFERINNEYFQGLLEMPNLVWGQDSFRKLGHYEYATNTIMISNIFQGEPEFTDYIMYHEMLHKKQGRKITETGRSIHHDSNFRREEAKYKEKDSEIRLKEFIRRKRLRGVFKFW
jgi:hypothetical protein